MNLTAIALRLLGVYRVWQAMARGDALAEAQGPVVKLPTGVYDLIVCAVRRKD